ncbi:MAG: AAA family ATPase, partial [Kofleriaceae bacterium]|nr:AAA family ATPase [Kofleriaceae bacterium]
MRILAIRGCNLASLAGEFEIDLATGALGGAGVFAIVGPTGAGKSTLLDAMCVALFDRTPRLTNHSRVVVGRGDDDPTALGAQDVRTLLRRGASSGWAEVDFESGDSRRYRARWSVRRARGATDGRFQSQQVTLAALDRSGLVAEQLGGTKTETLEAIHQRLGLTFDQFRRSALLAQGEFAAFLRADGKDRSELLERMTGTEIYSELSIAAHVKAALAEQQLRERQAVALAIGVLSPEARAQAEADLDLAKQAQAASRARLTAAEAAARWLAEAKSRRRALVEAETARSAAEQAVEAAQVLRAELALRRRAEAMRPAWDDAAKLDRQLAIAQGDLAAATEAAERAGAAQREVATRRARLVELHTPIREARIAAGLRIDERAPRVSASPRRKRGTAIAEDAAPRARSRASEAIDRAPAPGHVASAMDAFDVDLEARAVEATTRDAAWLAARASLVDGIATWRELDGNLAQHAALAAEIVAADRALDEHARRRDLLGRQRTAAALEHQQAQAKLGEAQREADAYSKRRGLTLDAARRAEDEARKRSGDFDRLLALTGEARGAATARAELERQVGELAAAAAADVEARRIAESARDTASTLRTERARVVEELRKAAGYAHARTELVDGEPCALCGATEHPWASRGSFEPLIADAQDKLAESSDRFERALATLAGLDARDQHRAVERQRLTSCLATAERSAAAAQASWREQLAALGELLLVDDPSSDAAKQLADDRIVAARSKLDAARTARHQAEAVAKAGADAQALVQTRHNDVEQHARSLRELDTALASIEASVARVRGERAGKVAREIELLVAIDAALAHWTDGLSPVEQRAIEQARAVIAPVTNRAPERRPAKPTPKPSASSGVVETATDAGKSERLLAPDALAIL